MATGVSPLRICQRPGRAILAVLFATITAAVTASAQSRPATQPEAATPTLGRVVVGDVREIAVARGDTLRSIGARHGVDPAIIATANGIAVEAPLAIGRRLRIESRHIAPEGVATGTIVVNVPQRMLFLGTEAGVQAWPVAVGRRSWPTPIGPFTIVSREQHPTWNVPASIMEEARRDGKVLPPSVPPGPDNPLGDHWLGLSVGGVGLHGTNASSSIYQAVTHGCIRLHPDDVAELFAQVQVGTRGLLVYEPVLIARDGDAVVLEVHPDVYRKGPVDVEAYVRALIARLEPAAAIDWARVAATIKERAGIPRVVSAPSLVEE